MRHPCFEPVIIGTCDTCGIYIYEDDAYAVKGSRTTENRYQPEEEIYRCEECDQCDVWEI